MWGKRTHGRAARGEGAMRMVQGGKGTNLTMTSAVSNVGGLIYQEPSEGGMTSKEKINLYVTLIVFHAFEFPVVFLTSSTER